MKLKIWQDEDSRRHTSVDGFELSGMITGLDLTNHPHHPSKVTLHLVAEEIDVEVDADIELIVGDNTFKMKAIREG